MLSQCLAAYPKYTVINPKTDAQQSLNDLYKRPGFLLRRAHQICVSIFLEEAAELGITTTQYGTLVILRYYEGLDQIGLSRKVGLDRTTTALVVRKLQGKGLVVRTDDSKDRRRKVIVLTARGERVLQSLGQPARRARDKVLSAFSPEEAKIFSAFLARLVQAFNGQTRAPILDGANTVRGRSSSSAKS